MYWLDLNKDDFNSFKKKVVILPAASCEQHSTHLPVGTDTFIAENIIKKVENGLKKNLVVLPTIWSGFSEHHHKFKGTISISNLTLINIVREISTSVYKNGFTKLLIVNSHGGNISALRVAVNEVGVNNSHSPILLSYWDLIKEEMEELRKSNLGTMAHAGELETSLAAYLFEDLINKNKIDTKVIHKNDYYISDIFASNKYYGYYDFKSLSDSGVIGDPGLYSKKEGEKIFELIIKKMTDFINYYLNNNI